MESIKLAIITGASSGIGEQIAISLSQPRSVLINNKAVLRNGYNCILAGRNENKLKQVQQKCPNSTYHILDLEDHESIQNFSNDVIRNVSTIISTNLKSNSNADVISDLKVHIVLINNAGIVERTSFTETTPESWQKQFQTNLFGPALLTQKLLPLLIGQKSARIINISSTLGIKPIADTSAYSASKAAMNNWTQSLALELAKSKIPVNAICPGIIETPLQDFYQTKDDNLRSTLNNLQPMGRVGTPEDISQLVSFLADESNSWMTGSLIPLDGGILLG